MEDKNYDVIIVGAGISGAILAKVLAEAEKSVLILEAGDAAGMTPEGYQSYMETFYRASFKTPNSPYPANDNAPSPSVLNINQIQEGVPDLSGYFVQNGPLPFSSNYTRSMGGTTLHWLGTCLRMLPNDFQMKSVFDRGVDWPITYDDLQPYYEKAEWEIGVAADVEDQRYSGTGDGPNNRLFGDDYYYPMRKIPQSYLDMKLAQGLEGEKIRFGGVEYDLRVESTPQGRNSTPNQGYTPVGAVGDPYTGQRCEGNSNCIPICPVQAKYNALKTLDKVSHRNNVKIINQAVASKVELDSETGRVTGITYKRYADMDSPGYTTHTAQGGIYVIAAHAVESAKLLLASGAANSSDMLGRNLMDHPFMLTWGLMPEKVGSFRGPGSTSGIPTLRDGEFRKDRAAFRVEIGNWGWNFAAFAPFSTVATLVDQGNMFGARLRAQINQTVPRQMRLGFLLEQLPDPCNRVTINSKYLDQLQNYRPVIDYGVAPYTRAGLAAAKATSDHIFRRMGIENHTKYNPSDPGYLDYEGEGYSFHGSGHLVGTHRMGASRHDSVVDRNQRTWDHENLYLAGCGNMPTIATSNPTLTMAAMAFWAAENILKDLNRS